MDYEIVDEFGYDNDYEYLNELIASTLKRLKVENPIFSIIFVDNPTIQTLNKEQRNIDAITDVISFALEDTAGILPEGMRVLGDIYISIPRMKEQAIDYGHSEKRELSFLTVHGLLHLLGYDHMTEDDESVMFELQEVILDEAGITR